MSPEQSETWESHSRSDVALATIQWGILMSAQREAKLRLSPNNLFELRYEDLCQDPLRAIRRVAKFCKLDWSPLDPKPSSDRPLLLFAGQLCERIGAPVLVEACRLLIERGVSFHCVIVGEGPEKNALEAQVRRLGITDKILFASHDAPLERYLSIFDVFCLPSISEGLGFSLMEAMAAGRACIASDVGGISELISNGENGVLVPPGDPRALSAAISDLVANTGLRRRLAENAREKAANNFSIGECAVKTIEVYREVIGADETGSPH